MADRETLVERLRGFYRVPITDGLGPVGAGEEPDNPNEFVRNFETPPIQHEAASELDRLNAELDARDVEVFDAAVAHGKTKLELNRLNAKVVELEGVLARGMPFGYDPATGFFHEDDGGAPASCVHYVPAFEVADLSARLARAVEVMRPFAEAAKHFVVPRGKGALFLESESGRLRVKAAWFRRARAFLSEQENRHGNG